MKLTTCTKDVLNQFSKMNGFFEFKAGTRQRMLNSAKTVLVEAELDQRIPCDFGPIHLKGVTTILKSLDSPEISFQEDRLVFSEGCSELVVEKFELDEFVAPKQIDFPENGMRLHMSKEIVEKVIKLKRSLGHSWLEIVGDGEAAYLRTTNRWRDENDHSLTMRLCSTSRVFSLAMRLDELSLVKDDFTLHLSNRQLIKMCPNTFNLTYFVALETADYYDAVSCDEP